VGFVPSALTYPRPFSIVGTASARTGVSSPWLSTTVSPELTITSTASVPGSGLVNALITSGGSARIAAVNRLGPLLAGAAGAAAVPALLLPPLDAAGLAPPACGPAHATSTAIASHATAAPL